MQHYYQRYITFYIIKSILIILNFYLFKIFIVLDVKFNLHTIIIFISNRYKPVI